MLAEHRAQGGLGQLAGGGRQALGNLAQVAIWALVFQWLGEFERFTDAFYHSAVNFATLGYGDIVMSDKHRLLGPLEAINGVLMIGVSTAALMAAFQDAMKKTILMFALLAAPAAQAWNCSYEKQIDEVLDLAGSEELVVNAAAGALEIRGGAAEDRAVIRGTLCVSEEEWLDETRIDTESGRNAEIAVTLPDISGWSLMGSRYVYMDLEIDVPENLFRAYDVRGVVGEALTEQLAKVLETLDAIRGDISMADAIVHRGPDDDGFYEHGPLIFGMRRLSIIDLTSGAQPMTTTDGGLTVVFNGEIYNHVELRRELKANYAFQTASDCEVILPLWLEEGNGFLNRLRGMFAFVLYDAAQDRWTMQGVNVTLGLPIVRTSVDHGTALDLAGSGRVDPGSLIAAIDPSSSSSKRVPGISSSSAPRR